MIGYSFLFLAVLTGVAKGYCGKKTSGYVNTLIDGLILQHIRLALCMLIGILLVLISGNTFQLDIPVLFISLLNGIANAVFLISWLFAVKNGAYLFVDICLTAGGILIPCICGAIFFGGNITLLQYVGIFVMLIAVLVMNSYNSSITNKKISPRDLLLFLCVAVSNGLIGLCEKWFAYYTANNNSNADLSSFSFATFFFAGIIMRLALQILCKKENKTINECNKTFPFKKLWIYIVLIAFFLFFNTYLTTLANTYIQNTVLIYPLKFGSNLILSSVMAAVIFKEKINMRSIAGMILISISILLINVL